MYDAIIIGARCAGSATAIYLARLGLKVLLVDRATFPSNVVSSHHIGHKGIAELRIMGLLDEVANSGCPAIEKFVLGVQSFDTTVVDFRRKEIRSKSFRTPFPPNLREKVGTTYAPRRSILDYLLLNAAARSGAEIRQRFRVLGPILNENQRVVGIEAESGGRRLLERSSIVIGADGMNSQFARHLKARKYHYVPSQTCVYHSYFSDFDARGMEFFLGDGYEVMAVPTHDELTCIGVGVRHSAAREFRANLEENFDRIVNNVPEFAERFHASRRQEQYVGSHRLPNFFRNCWGDGWALVGDAGYHRDPISGRGISDAFRHARMLAGAIATGLGRGEPVLSEALRDYQEQRDKDVENVYAATIELAKLVPPSPRSLALLQTIGTG